MRALDVSQLDPKLFVAYPPSQYSKKLLATKVKVSAELGLVLREIAVDVLRDLKDRRWRAYDPGSNTTSEEAEFVAGAAIDDESELAALLQNFEGREALGAAALEEHDPKYYAITYGDGDDSIHFVRARKMATISAGGKWVTYFRGDALQLVPQRSFIVERAIDLIIHPLGIVILKQAAFDGLFRSADSIRSEISGYVAQLEQRYPMTAQTRKDFLEWGSTRLMQRRLRSIMEKGSHLKIDFARLRKGMKNQKLDEKRFVTENKLSVDKEHALLLVKFINQEVYRGEFTGELLAADGTSVVEL
jgi:hypothetical protein